ncbi:MAG: PPC domain-containing protein [Planctomycetes bacterium]|nr:PPC domain-containing protein [Planctomycetota bacterium]
MRTKRTQGFKLSWFSLCAVCAICGESSAAPPAVTHLFPAGAQRGTTTEITAAGTFEPWPVKVAISGKGVSVVAAKDKGKFAVTVAKDAIPGIYWMRAHNDDGVSGPRPFIVGTLPEISEKEPNDEFQKPQAIQGNVVVNGKLEKSGDVDCFGVSLKKGQTLVASLEANYVLKSPMDAIMQIVSTDGFTLDENHDFHGLDPQLAFTAPKDGTYVVRVFAFPSQPDSSIRFFGSDACVYRLTLTTGAFADYAVPTAEGVRIHGWNIPKTGKLVAVPKLEADETHATVFDPEIANPLRFRVETHPQHAALEAEQRTPLAVPFSLTTRLFSPGVASRSVVSLKKGQAITVQVESRVLGLAVNPVIEILDKDQKRVARTEPAKLGGDTALSFTPTVDGQYTIAVTDLFSGGGGPRDIFVLRVTLLEPDYELSVLADRFTLEAGKPLNIPVKLARKGGFAKPVEAVAEGLPEGVKFEITQPAKPDPNTIQVTLTTEKPVTAPFRLLGKVKDEPKLTRVGVAPLAEFEITTPDLWIAAGVAPPPKKKK